MNEYERSLVNNTANLLLTPMYMSPKQEEISKTMYDALIHMNKIDKEIIDMLINASYLLNGRTINDRRLIQTMRNDLIYLKMLK